MSSLTTARSNAGPVWKCNGAHTSRAVLSAREPPTASNRGDLACLSCRICAIVSRMDEGLFVGWNRRTRACASTSEKSRRVR